MSKIALHTWHYDVTLLQREMLSTLATLEGWCGRPRILDVDDSIHLRRGGATAKYLAQQCDRIICGNQHLASIYEQWNNDVLILPTAVDVNKYRPRPAVTKSNVILGWIGSSSNLRYLEAIEPALAMLLDDNPCAKLHVVCDEPPCTKTIQADRIQFTKWSEDAEVGLIQSFDIGLMPLQDSPWARGKCSFKMLQYLSCGLPVVVAPVGMNADVLKLGDVGIGVTTISQWVEALSFLLQDEAARLRLGLEGRKVVVRHFSIETLAPLYARYLNLGAH
jgi:glycosyltransferase involved in cell wall biosynthesis